MMSAVDFLVGLLVLGGIIGGAVPQVPECAWLRAVMLRPRLAPRRARCRSRRRGTRGRWSEPRVGSTRWPCATRNRCTRPPSAGLLACTSLSPVTGDGWCDGVIPSCAQPITARRRRQWIEGELASHARQVGFRPRRCPSRRAGWCPEGRERTSPRQHVVLRPALGTRRVGRSGCRKADRHGFAPATGTCRPWSLLDLTAHPGPPGSFHLTLASSQAGFSRDTWLSARASEVGGPVEVVPHELREPSTRVGEPLGL